MAVIFPRDHWAESRILRTMEEQKNFAIYKSSAGSGKTSALIGVFLELALDSESPSYFKRILAVTFTNKAANEMKERFLAELNQLSQMSLPYERKSNYMTDKLLDATGLQAEELRNRATAVFEIALQDYGEISISTIDRFNHKLIRSFSRDLHLPSDFEVEMEVKNFFGDVVRRLLSDVDRGSFLTQHLVSFISSQLDADKKPSVQAALEELRPLIMNDDGLEPMSALSEIDENRFAEWRKMLRKNCREFEGRCKGLADKVFSLLESQNISYDHLNYKKNGWYGFFKKLQTINNAVAKVKLHGSIKNFDSWAPANLPAGDRAPLDSIQPELSDLYDRAVDMMDNEFGSYMRRRIIASQIDLLALLSRLQEVMTLLKEERNILPITEFNRLISSAIRNEPVAFIYENYGSGFNHILIDEFQDTGELQWKNMVPLIEESLSRGHRDLVVGDAKQSIYRWRGGKAEQLIRLPELDPNDPSIDEITRNTFRRNADVQALNTNYRSLTHIVEFNNVFIAELGQELLTDELHLREYSGENVRQSVPKNKMGGSVEVRYLGDKPDRVYFWAALLEQIQDALSAGFRFGDMVILVRSARKEGEDIVRMLSKNDIPFTTADSFGLDQNSSVEALIGLMRLSIEPNLAPAKIRAMRTLSSLHDIHYSPAKYRLFGKDKRSSNIDFEKFARTIDRDYSMEDLKGKGAFDLCRFLLRRLFPKEKRSDVFLKSFLNLIFKKGGTRMGPGDFLTWWDSLAEKPSASGGLVGNRIQIQTIHKAKGLQYRICFMPFVDWKYSVGREMHWFAIDDLHEDFIPYAPLPMSKKPLEAMGFGDVFSGEEEERRFDNLNLIYVAVTRAVERLYINYATSSSNSVGKDVHAAMKSIENTEDEEFLSHLKISELSMEYEDDQPDKTAKRKDLSEDPPCVWRYGGPEEPLPKDSFLQPADDGHVSEIVLAIEPIIDLDIEERFDPGDDSLAPYRDLGIRFHDLIVHGPEKKKVLSALDRQLKNGALDAETARELGIMVQTLYGDPFFSEMIIGARWIPERDITFDGQILRPDLILDHPEHIVVLDFKTGIPRPQHRRQISEYRKAVSLATSKPTKSYLVYLSPLEWIEEGGRK